MGNFAREIADSEFESEVLKSTQPVLVDFWAPWCGPCRAMAPVIEELAAENAGKIKVIKINTDNSPNLAASYGVNSIPTLMIFKNGEVVERYSRVMPKKALQEAINQAAG